MNPLVFSLSRIAHTFSTPIRAARARRLLRRGGFVFLSLDGPLVEVNEPPPWWRRRSRRPTSLERMRELCSALAADEKVTGLLVDIRSLRAGAATATSLRRILRELAQKKKVVVYLPEGGGSREMLVASAASVVIAAPQATISPLGVAIEARYFRRALDKIGVLPEIFARGEFKTAGESLARDSMSEEQRKQLGAILDVFENELVDALADGRHLPLEAVRTVFDGGPYRAADAKAARLIDASGYEDELPRLIGAPDAKPVDARRYLSLRKKPPVKKRVGVVHVRGPIVSRAPLPLGRVAVDERVIGALRKAREARGVDGVVLIVDSPGGSVLASDRIHHEVLRLGEKKPVVAYFGNVAASGGYYVAAGAQAIVAEPTAITGSIGVIAGHLVLGPLLTRLGIVTELVKRGARADMLSASRPLDEGEREAMTREIEGYYWDFVNVVAKGRNRAPEDVEKLARGRVYSGLDAKRVGLVDALGGFDVALDLVREKMGESRPVRPEVIRPPRITPKPPEVPAPFVEAIASLGGSAAAELLTLSMGVAAEERVLAWVAIPPM